jgi:DNA-binding MarR family transcriptional regulator
MKCQKGDVCMVDDLVILAQFVKLGRLRKKVFMELAQKEISQICKLGEKKGKYCTSSTYHAVYDLIDKGLVEYVDLDSKRRKEVRLTDLGYNVFEKLDIVCW